MLETSINIRKAREEDVNAINAFYQSVYGKSRDEKQFNWEYNSSPAGKSIYVLAEHNGEIVGTQAAIPYFLVSGSGETFLSAKSEDTLVSPKHRGKQIFEKMYVFLLEECKKQNILVIWGFTYADKPFKKIGFEIPYKACLGLLVQDVRWANTYLNNLSLRRTAKERLGIFVLTVFSFCKANLSYCLPGKSAKLKLGSIELSGSGKNYLHSKEQFGLLLDQAFLNYRINSNPYPARYSTYACWENDRLLISATYSISETGVCYFIHLYFAPETTKATAREFMRALLKVEEVKSSKLLRFWGFRHNLQNRKEVEYLSACGFTFINKGIQMVWKKLDEKSPLKPENFVLSRMASQGTD